MILAYLVYCREWLLEEAQRLWNLWTL